MKLLAHQFGLEFISLNPLFTGVVTANIFLLGFLIAGVLADYKESEKLPGELANSIETIMDECSIIYKNKKAEPAKECLKHTLNLINSIDDWFLKKERTRALMDKTSFVSAIVFLQTYMIALIKDLDDPFEYYGEDIGPDGISLKPLDDLKLRIEEKIRLHTGN